MNDAEVVDFIVGKCNGSIAEAARQLGLRNRQVLIHWRNRRIAPTERGRVYAAANKLGARLPLDWLIATPDNMESTNGRKGKATRRRKGARKQNGKAEGGKATRSRARNGAGHRS